MLSRLRQFKDMFQIKLADKNPYTARIGEMRLRLAKLQELNEKARDFRAKSLDGWKNIAKVLHY